MNDKNRLLIIWDKKVEALDKIMAAPGDYKLFPEIKSARLSIAGAQDKLPVYIKKDHSFRLFAKEMNIRPGKLAVLMNEIYQSVYKTYTSLLADHEKKYGVSRIDSDLSKVIQSNLNNMNCYIGMLEG